MILPLRAVEQLVLGPEFLERAFAGAHLIVVQVDPVVCKQRVKFTQIFPAYWGSSVGSGPGGAGVRFCNLLSMRSAVLISWAMPGIEESATTSL